MIKNSEKTQLYMQQSLTYCKLSNNLVGSELRHDSLIHLWGYMKIFLDKITILTNKNNNLQALSFNSAYLKGSISTLTLDRPEVFDWLLVIRLSGMAPVIVSSL